MNQNLFVWGTSIISLLLGAAISYLVQTKVIEKSRIFQQADKANENKQKILLSRIDLIENLITEVFFNLKEIISLCVKFDNDDIGPQSVSDGLASLQNKIQYLTALTSILDDKELTQRLFTFESCFVNFNKEINELLSNKKFDGLGTTYGQIQQPFVEIVRKLDSIRIRILDDAPSL